MKKFALAALLGLTIFQNTAFSSVHFQFDGGGMRCLTTAIILADIEEKLQKPVHEILGKDGSIMGVSCGAILASLLTIPGPDGKIMAAKDLVAFFGSEGPSIFGEVETFASGVVSDLMEVGMAAGFARLFGGSGPSIESAIQAIVVPETLAPEGKIHLQSKLNEFLPAKTIADARVQLWILAHKTAPEKTGKYVFDSVKAREKKNTLASSAVVASASIKRLFGHTEIQFLDGSPNYTFLDAGDAEVQDPEHNATQRHYSKIVEQIKSGSRDKEEPVLLVSFGTGIGIHTVVETESNISVTRVEPLFKGYNAVNPLVGTVSALTTQFANKIPEDKKPFLNMIPLLLELADASEKALAYQGRVAQSYLATDEYETLIAQLQSIPAN